MEFKEVLVEAERLRKAADGGPNASIAYLEELLATRPARSEQGWLNSLLAQYHMRSREWTAAFLHLDRALALLDELEAAPRRATAMTSKLELCCDTHSVAMGFRHVRDVEAFFAANQNVEAAKAKAQFLHQYGRLLVIAGDGEAAIPQLAEAAAMFAAQGKTEESYMAKTRQARALAILGDCEAAETLCREVLLGAHAESVLGEAECTMSEIKRLQGDLGGAELYLDSAIKRNAGNVGQEDYRMVLQVLLEQAGILEARGVTNAAVNLRRVVRHMEAVSSLRAAGL